MGLSLACFWAAALGRVWACDVEVAPDAGLSWHRAADLARVSDETAGECAVSRLEVRDGVGHLIYTVRNGQTAERLLLQPEQLASALRDLSVIGTAANPADAQPVDRAQGPASGRANAGDLSALFTLLGGVRVLGDYAEISPLLVHAILVRFRRWEVGALANWEVQYYDLSSGWREKRLAVAPALTFARRQPFSAFTLLAGARFGMGAMISGYRRRRFSPPPEINDVAPLPANFTPPTLYEGRTGIFVGGLVPIHRLVRIRMELAADLIWFRVYGRSPPYYRPGWAVSLAVGFELGRSS